MVFILHQLWRIREIHFDFNQHKIPILNEMFLKNRKKLSPNSIRYKILMRIHKHNDFAP